ncbi:MAG: hypothetical protein R3F55_12740 [Alphaproteobacteria bacterium]
MTTPLAPMQPHLPAGGPARRSRRLPTLAAAGGLLAAAAIVSTALAEERPASVGVTPATDAGAAIAQHDAPVPSGAPVGDPSGEQAQAGGGASAPAAAPQTAGEAALERYGEVLDRTGEDGFDRRVGREVTTLDPAETNLLLANGWQVPAMRLDDDFFDHGQRLRTFVAIAVALGYAPQVGAQQANWGTPQEHGLGDSLAALESDRAALAEGAHMLGELRYHLSDAEAVLAEMRAARTTLPETVDSATIIAELETEIESVRNQMAAIEFEQERRMQRVAALEAQLAAAMSLLAPAGMPSGGWEIRNLDVDGDGRVTGADLAAARSVAPPDAQTQDGPSR